MSDECGPWIAHDGKGCPSDVFSGLRLRIQDRAGRISSGRTPSHVKDAPQWIWPKPGCADPENDILAYQVCKPRGFIILESILTNLPEKVDA